MLVLAQIEPRRGMCGADYYPSFCDHQRLLQEDNVTSFTGYLKWMQLIFIQQTTKLCYEQFPDSLAFHVVM